MHTEVMVLAHGTRGDIIEALREYAVRRVELAVRRLTHHIDRVTVRLADENGPRGGVDSRCSITADLVHGGRLFVEATAARPFAAIALAAARLSEAVGRTAARSVGHRARSAAPSRAAAEARLPGRWG